MMRQRELNSQKGGSQTQRRGLGLQVCTSLGSGKEGVARGKVGRKDKGQDRHKLSSLFIPVGETEAISGPATSR